MNDPEKRFLFFSGLFLVIFFVGGWITYQTIYFEKIILATAASIFAWISFEHESSLSSKKLYLNFFFYSVLLFVLGFIFKNLDLENEGLLAIIIASRILLYFLIVQKVLRYIFLKFFKNEPILGMHGMGIRNAIYSFILMMIMAMSPVVISELFKAFNF